MSPAFFWSSYSCWHYANDIESYSSLEYFFSSSFPLKEPWLALISCCLTAWSDQQRQPSNSVSNLLLIHWVKKACTVSKSFLYLSGWALTVVTSVETFHTWCHSAGIKLLILDQGLSVNIPWHIWQHTFPSSMPSSLCHMQTSAKLSWLLMQLHWKG